MPCVSVDSQYREHPVVLVTHKGDGSHNPATCPFPSPVSACKPIYSFIGEIPLKVYFHSWFIEKGKYLRKLCIQICKIFIFLCTGLSYYNYFYGRFCLFFNFAVSKCGYELDTFLATCPYSPCVAWIFSCFITYCHKHIDPTWLKYTYSITPKYLLVLAMLAIVRLGATVSLNEFQLYLETW